MKAIDLKIGDNIDFKTVSGSNVEIKHPLDTKALLEKLRAFRGRLPADFHFDRLEANSRGGKN